MKTDNNWKATRVLAEDLDSLLGLPPNISENYFKILENLIVHKFLEELLESGKEDGGYEIEIPYLGSLVVNIKGSKITTDFVVRNSFYQKIKRAYSQNQSPLTDQCEDLLSQSLVEKFKEGGL